MNGMSPSRHVAIRGCVKNTEAAATHDVPKPPKKHQDAPEPLPRTSPSYCRKPPQTPTTHPRPPVAPNGKTTQKDAIPRYVGVRRTREEPQFAQMRASCRLANQRRGVRRGAHGWGRRDGERQGRGAFQPGILGPGRPHLATSKRAQVAPAPAVDNSSCLGIGKEQVVMCWVGNLGWRL